MTNRNFVLPVYRRFGSYEEVSPVNRLPVCGSQIEVVKNWAQAIVISPAGELEVFPGVGLSDVVHFSLINFDVYNRSSSSILLTVKAYGKYILDADKGIVTSGTTIYLLKTILLFQAIVFVVLLLMLATNMIVFRLLFNLRLTLHSTIVLLGCYNVAG